MKCEECAMFDNRKDIDGNFTCSLCSGTYVTLEEKENSVCKYTGDSITNQYASKKFWMSPIDYFYKKLDEIGFLIKYAQKTLISDEDFRQILARVLYSQLVTALEVYLREKFRQGMDSPKAFDGFIKKHLWDKKYYPHEIYGNVRQIVEIEVNKINFQNFHEIGSVYKTAFNVDIFSFPISMKQGINRILRFRHSLIHQDEIWEDEQFVRIDLHHILSDISIIEAFIFKVQGSFEKNIGRASEIKMDRVKLDLISDNLTIDSCEKCPLGSKFKPNVIVCFEGAYDGIGFGINASDWNDPSCGISFKDAIYQRKILGEKGLFGLINLIPLEDEEENEKLSEKRHEEKG